MLGRSLPPHRLTEFLFLTNWCDIILVMTRVAVRSFFGSSAPRNLDGRSLCCALDGFLLLIFLLAPNSTPIASASTHASSSDNRVSSTQNIPVAESKTALPAPISGSPIAADQTITLTVWSPEAFSPEAAEGGQVLQGQIQSFEQTRPNIHVKFELKNPYGKGGLLDFLTKVQTLIPERLPDIILIDSREMDVAARTGLVQTLDRDFPSGTYADMLPPAKTLANHDGVWLSLPIVVDVQHLVYNTKSVSSPPASWDDLIKANAPFAFPAAGDDAFLFQYLENQGRISNSPQPAPLNISVTASVLSFYQRAHANNLVPDSVLGIKSTHDVWPLFADGEVPLAQVEANDYIAEHGRVPNTGFAPLPTLDGSATTIVSSWNYAIVTNDPGRHAAAAAFLNWIDDPARLGEWAIASQMVPARRSAFAASISPRDYGDFLLRLLDNSIIAPTFAERAAYADSWDLALQDVLRGQATPSEAALKATQALLQ